MQNEISINACVQCFSSDNSKLLKSYIYFQYEIITTKVNCGTVYIAQYMHVCTSLDPRPHFL